MNTPLDENLNILIDDYYHIKEFLLSNGQVSHETFVTEAFRKHLLISCASFFETQIQGIILEFVKRTTPHPFIHSMVKVRIISRQYHTYFDWKNKSANQFYGMFGDQCKEFIKQKFSEMPALKEAEKSFLELGYERNLLVHENYLDYQLNKTSEEIWALYQNAKKYVALLQECFNCAYTL